MRNIRDSSEETAEEHFYKNQIDNESSQEKI